MDEKLVDQYWNQYGTKYLSRNITRYYPETKIIPQYIVQNFAQAGIVLNLGFGTGPWFWASFLPNLVRLDGIDLHPEALAAADRVFEQNRVSPGYARIHRQLGRKFTRDELKALMGKRGNFFFFDYTKPWPKEIVRNRYDLITEHGGGFGEMKSESELVASVKHCAKVLKKGGCLFFANFQMKTVSVSPAIRLTERVLVQAAWRAGMEMIDFQTHTPTKRDRATSSIDKMFYGYAKK
jgi:hypothetical protein